MRCDSMLNGNAIAEQSIAIISRIKREIDMYNAAIRVMEMFAGNNLEGQAVDALRKKLEVYADVTRKLIEADEKDIEDLYLLAEIVSGVIIDGQEIIEAKITATNNATNCANMAYQYELLACSSLFEFEKEYYINLAQTQRKFESVWNRIYEKWQEQEELYDRIDVETGNLFKQGNEIRCGILLLINEDSSTWDINDNFLNLVRTIGLEDREEDGSELLRKYLENQKDEKGKPLYTKEQIDKIIDYMQKNYQNQLNNLSVLNSYCATEFEKLLNMCPEFFKDYDKVLTDEEIRELLLKCEWDESDISQEVIDGLQDTMKKFNIDTQEKVCAFLAQCTYETGCGKYTIELGDEIYFSSKEYGSKYRGAGYIQLTYKYGYQAFTTYLVLQEYPELKNSIEYRNPASNNAETIEYEYYLMVEEAEKRGIDISYYTNIVDIGYSYLAENFAWQSAGYYWDINNINDVIEDGGTINDVTAIVNYYDDTYSERESIYYTLMGYSTSMFE